MSLRRSPRRASAFLTANRANAQKSSGPRTRAGKQRSAANAFRNGSRTSAAFWVGLVPEMRRRGPKYGRTRNVQQNRLVTGISLRTRILRMRICCDCRRHDSPTEAGGIGHRQEPPSTTPGPSCPGGEFCARDSHRPPVQEGSSVRAILTALLPGGEFCARDSHRPPPGQEGPGWSNPD